MWQWYTLEDIVLPSSPAAFSYLPNWGLSQGLSGKESTCQCRRCRRCRFHPWVGKIPWKNKWQSTPVFLPGKPHGQNSLMGYRLWGHKELDRTKQLSTHTHTHLPDWFECWHSHIHTSLHRTIYSSFTDNCHKAGNSQLLSSTLPLDNEHLKASSLNRFTSISVIEIFSCILSICLP